MSHMIYNDGTPFDLMDDVTYHGFTGQTVTVHHDPMETPGEDSTTGVLSWGYAEQVVALASDGSPRWVVLGLAHGRSVVIPIANVHSIERD